MISFAVSSIALSVTSITGQPTFSTNDSKYSNSSLILVSVAYLAESPNPNCLSLSLRIRFNFLR